MPNGSMPWHEAWYTKLGAVALGIVLIYAAQLRYERGVRADERRINRERLRSEIDPSFEFVGQLNFAGQSLQDRRDAVGALLPGLHFLPFQESLADVRALICVRPPITAPPENSEPTGGFDGSGGVWTFRLKGDRGADLALYPMATSSGNYLGLRLPYASAVGIQSGRVCALKDGKLFQSIPVSDIPALVHITLPAPSHNLPVEVQLAPQPIDPFNEANQEWPVQYSRPIAPPRFQVRLLKPLAAGETAFARIADTDYEKIHTINEWEELKNQTAVIDSPCGTLARDVKVSVMIGRPKQVERTVTVPLGQVNIWFDQPVFLINEARSVQLTPTSYLGLPQQGVRLRRPPSRRKRAIRISGLSLRDWSDKPSEIPDQVTHVNWLSPKPEDLGLDVIWSPWGPVRATSATAVVPHPGAITATLDLHAITWDVVGSYSAVVRVRGLGTGKSALHS